MAAAAVEAVEAVAATAAREAAKAVMAAAVAAAAKAALAAAAAAARGAAAEVEVEAAAIAGNPTPALKNSNQMPVVRATGIFCAEKENREPWITRMTRE